ncbi:stress response protein nst1-like [Phragmites australis]|uniref:stress response protein nst1-like n=1 Tax=Phragmites australis TaxID=29695 RepID=UPI002D77E5BF|nr:stress response protein nst1-like [Phragmites australis]
MCILCSVQRWSRRVATMLPWLVVPLLFLWGTSQLLLPAAYRFEVTSPRLACVSVLLLTLFWYEILLPRLSLWRARRSARLREERRARALELHKLRKTATRRCRNCNNPYRDQNPGGGKFMCSYCGHVSKRPVLELNSAGKVPRGWPCAQDCDSAYWPDLRCPGDNSFLGFSWRLFSSFCVATRWFSRKIFRFTSSVNGEGLGPDGKRLAKRGENEGKAEESRVDKAKRKAEEKRLARLEREMLEEEERKQREEMAKLVEERRRLRDEKAEAEERSKGATPVGEKDARREAEKQRLDRRKKEDKGSSKSNSDCEDIDRRLGREGDRKRDLDRKSDLERREGYKPHYFEANNHSSKILESKTKYFGRMTGGFLSSSRGFGGGSFFGRSAHSPAPQVNKVSRPAVPATDQGNAVKRDAQPAAAQAMAKSATAGETINPWTNFNRTVSPNVQPHPTGLKKSWHQLFNRSASVSPCPDVTASACEMNRKPEPNGAQISNAHNFLSQYPPLDSTPNLSQPMQFPGFPPVNGAPANMPLPRFPAGRMPFYDEAEPTVYEEPEQFEDPCYDPDAIALLGPVSESLDNFPLDLDCGFISSDVTKESHARPSPIESPLSRSRLVEERPIKPPQSSLAKGPDGSILPEASSEQGTWQMWSTPLVQESLGLRGPQNQWLLPNTNQFNHGTNFLNGGTRSPLGTSLNDSDPWLQKAPFQQLPPDTPSLFVPYDVSEKAIHNNLIFGSPNQSAHASFGPPGHSWSKEEVLLNGTQETGHISSPSGRHVGGGLFSANPDVQSVWSFDEKETT